jgi:protein-disulfide isomerase
VLSDALTSSVTLGIVAAFVIGKPAGILFAAWVGTRRVFGGSRLTVTWPALLSGATAAGIGFTVSLLIATLAFEGTPLLDQAKIGIVATAILSPALSYLSGVLMRHLPDELRARQLGQVAETIVDLVDDVDPERDHIRGRMDAPVTIVEYGDYECPYCAHAAPTINQLLGRLPDELRYVWRHLPLTDVHPDAQNAAEAAEAAAAQGRFWEMHDVLLDEQADLTPLGLFRHAEELGLDADQFGEDLRKHRYGERVAEDVASADASGVSGTPTFFINGRRHQGVYDLDTLTAAIKAAVRRPAVRATVTR